MCELDLETCEVWREERRKARKAHRCSTCRADIRPGDVYVNHFSVFEGDATTEAMCLPCEDIAIRFAEHHGTRTPPGSMLETLQDCFGQEGREYWTDEDRGWRRDVASILWRWRAARRGSAGRKP